MTAKNPTVIAAQSNNAQAITTAASEQALHKRLKQPTAKITQLIEHLVTEPGITITNAAAQAGLTREYVSRALKMPHVRAALLERAQRELPIHALQAPARIGELARTARSEKVRLEANQDLLNRTQGQAEGPQQVVNIQINI